MEAVMTTGKQEREQDEGAQKRFSFYNAQDFVTDSPPQPHRFQYYDASSSGEQQQQTPKDESHNNLDSIEILRSLQEHEQQRLEILGGGAASDTTPAASDNNRSNQNPYEDAIKEALELLRKHRGAETTTLSTTSPDSQQELTMPPAASRPKVSSPVGPLEETIKTAPDDSSLSDTQPQLTIPPSKPHISAPVGQLEEMIKTPPEADRILQMRDAWEDRGSLLVPPSPSDTGSGGTLGEAYQAEIEARRKQRQERMARYASRLAELKQESQGGQDSCAVSDQNSTSTPKAPQNLELTKAQEPSNKDEEVHRGVERVLLAILERAHNSRGRTKHPPRVPEEEKKSGTEEASRRIAETPAVFDDSLLRVMSDLLRPSTSESFGGDASHAGGDASHATQESDTLAAAGSEISRLVDSKAHEELDTMVERVFQEPTDEDIHRILGGTTVSQDLSSSQPPSPPKEQEPDEDKGRSTDEHVDELDLPSKARTSQSDDDFTDGSDGEYEESTAGQEDTLDKLLEDSEDEATDSYEGDDDDDETEGSDQQDQSGGVLTGVLGPLSRMGGTTGVVLESDDSSEDVGHSILDSISAAAMNLVGGSPKGTNPAKNKYSTSTSDYDDESSSSSQSSSSSSKSRSEMEELTRTLCAHLFPDTFQDRDKLLTRIPNWDESNPDEPGYRIIRLNSLQLKSVEREFERFMKEFREHSEHSRPSSSDVDESSFERDLKEAEDLLDREERRGSGGDAGVKASRLDSSMEDGEESHSLQGFPGVKPAGKGEMGDLEYFHLPIIFKSHVTGFEATKDMYLEAGNVVAGQYLVESELGSAAFSTAYRCIDLNSEGDGPDGHEEVCLKVIKNTKDFFDQSLDEIKILELLRQTGKCHENHILEMKTFFYHREHLVIVTELLRQNLFEFGKFIIDNDEEPYFTIPRLSYLSRQTLIAMDFIHKIGLVHSDVKPENILLSSYSRAQIKLIDFGSSCYLTDRQSSYIQSRSYRAPEVVLGLPYDGKIDIWSLGCVIAEMFTGEVTFQNDSVVSMLGRIEAICGNFPSHMIEQGRQSGTFFTKCGLLYEKNEPQKKNKSGSYSEDCSDDDDEQESTGSVFDIFQPKRTTLSARLGFEADLMTTFDTGGHLTREQRKQAVFVDFVRSLLTIDPDKRPTAAEALRHPWMEFAATLTEEDIKYPSN